MFRKLLIANRGEIACRIARTARAMGIATVAVYSEADARARHVREADEAVAIGPAPASESYLDIGRILAAAKATGAEAVHPGYGFLAENPMCAERCCAAGLVFVGPSPEAMRLLGDKAAAKGLAAGLGIPVVPGYSGEKQDPDTLARAARRIGFPLMIKAAAGGGGRGMRLVARPGELADAIDSAAREARAAFGDGRVLLEKAIARPRHIEVQVFADRYGSAVHLFERDCSLQRRHQKVIEEAPAPGLSPELRSRLTDAALKLAHAAGYEGAGTVEFLVEGEDLGPEARWYFIETNARLQVEHTVTEEITGLDLVEWQLRVAAGEPLPKAQDGITLDGHAIEARLYAEDPAAGFRPSGGPVLAFRVGQRGPGMRIESAIREGLFADARSDRPDVPTLYDPMLAKLVAHGRNREEARRRLLELLGATLVLGPRTNLAFLDALLRLPAVAYGRIDTGLIDREISALARPIPEDVSDAAAAAFASRRFGALPAAAEGDRPPSPWDATDGFQLGGARSIRRSVLVGGTARAVDLLWTPGTPGCCVRTACPGPNEEAPSSAVAWDGWIDDGARSVAQWRLHQIEIALAASGGAESREAAGGGVLRAPLSGRIARLFVEKGAKVLEGDRIAVVEAMKMEHVLHADRPGVVARLSAHVGAQVREGDIVAEITSEEGQ